MSQDDPSQNPHQVPPQTYYGEYPQPPYNVPPQGTYYGVPPQGPYGAPGYNPDPQSRYNYYVSSPLPLRQAISELPKQYIRVLTRASSFTFAAEMGKASWNILWVQLIGYAVITSILNYLHNALFPVKSVAYNTASGAPAQIASTFQAFAHVSPFFYIILNPIFFFIGEGIIYLLAKAFGGTGTFLKQGYSYLLVLVPVGIITSTLNFIPILGPLIALGIGIYGIVLQIFSLMPVHRIGGGKATAVVLIPLAIISVLAIVFVVIIIIAIAASIHPGVHIH